MDVARKLRLLACPGAFAFVAMATMTLRKNEPSFGFIERLEKMKNLLAIYVIGLAGMLVGLQSAKAATIAH